MALYTSNSEFDLETRVQITNEMPTTRTYEQAHHSLRNDTWKWLLGFEEVTYDLPVGGNPVFNQEAPVKIVNGKQAAEYGPKMKQVWDPASETYVEKAPIFHKMEINGVLESEHDLFLHEIYRYLNCLYPDHPDWLKLLTRNEIIDAFNNAAAMVDYKPNNEFFRLVAESIQADDPDVEEFKLNLRNLTSNAARRKFYGSTLGYRMLGHDALENVSIFPIGKALTLESVSKDDWRASKSNGWDPKKYIIDTFDERYQTLFRRVDWLGNNRDTSFTKANGYVYPSYTLGGYEDTQFEFVTNVPGEATAESFKLNQDSAYSFYDLTSGSQTSTGSISEVVTYNTWEPLLGESLVYISSDDKLYGVRTSLTAPVSFKKLIRYKSFEYIVNALKENGIDTSVLSDYGAHMPYSSEGKQLSSNTDWFSTFIRSVASAIGAYGGMGSISDEVDYFYNPIIKDTISLPIDEMCDCYPSNIEFNSNDTPVNKTAELDLSNAKIHKGDIVSINDYTEFPQPLKVAGGTCGQLRAKIKSPAFEGTVYNAISKYEPFDITNDSIVSNDNYGAIITLKDGRYGVMYGSLNIKWGTTSDGNVAFAIPDEITFNIRAIPDRKTQDIFKHIYGNDADVLINEVKSEIAEKEKELEKHYKLVVQDFNDDPTYIDLFINLPGRIAAQENTVDNLLEAIESLPDTATAEERAAAKEAYDTAVQQLKIYNDTKVDVYKKLTEVSYSNFGHYEECLSDINDLKEELAEYSEKKDALLENRELLFTNNRCSNITVGCKVEFFTFGSNESFTVLPFILDDCFISDFSFGNISLQRILFDDDMSEVVVSDVWRFADYNPVDKRDDVLYQLYASLDDASRQKAYTPSSSMKIYNEAEYELTAQVYVDKSVGNSCYELQFLTKDARTKFEALSVGSKVFGPGISGDTFVTKLNNYVATVNNPLPKGGAQTFTFMCSVTTSPASVLDDPFNYKRVMYENGSYDKETFFEHGVYGSPEWPNVSKAVMNGDLKDKQILNPTTFFKVVNKLYNEKLTEEKDLLIPSVAKNTRNVFVEVNADRLIRIKNHFGDKENLMNVEWLDYLMKEDETNLAKESINVGSNLILNADTSGFASLIPQSQYTDSNLKVMFQTNNWVDGTVPAYVQIGTGGARMKKYFKLVSNIQYPNVYGATFWDHSVEPMKDTDGKVTKDWVKDLEAEGGEVRKRSTYSNTDNTGSVSDDYSTYEDIDEPLFEIPLNEYNINLETYSGNKKFSTLDIMFYEQTFKNLTKEYDLQVGMHKALSNKLFNTEEFISIDSLTAQRTKPQEDKRKNIYYHYSDGSDEGYSKGDLLVVENDDPTFTKYDVVIGGCIGKIPYYYNKTCYLIVNTPYNSKQNEFPKLNDSNKDEFLRRWLIIKALVESSTDYSTLLEVYSKYKLGYGDDKTTFNFDDPAYKSTFENKLILFTYFDGNFGSPDILGLNAFDVVGLFWANDKVNLVRINKNYTLCTSQYDSNRLITTNEYNLFYGYNIYPIITEEGEIYFEQHPDDFKLEMATTDNWLMDLSNSVMNYTTRVFNNIKLPRNKIADGSYELDMYLDPHFTAEGYRYNDFLQEGVNAPTVNYCISQSAIRYDKKNDLFYTNACTMNDDGSLDTDFTSDAEYFAGELTDILCD